MNASYCMTYDFLTLKSGASKKKANPDRETPQTPFAISLLEHEVGMNLWGTMNTLRVPISQNLNNALCSCKKRR
jgi:hypothetical protein